MPRTPIGVVGRILGAPSEADANIVGFFVEVVDDAQGDTGGAFIYLWNGTEGFDSWVESIDDVDGYFDESGWQVEWFDEPPPDAQRGPTVP